MLEKPFTALYLLMMFCVSFAQACSCFKLNDTLHDSSRLDDALRDCFVNLPEISSLHGFTVAQSRYSHEFDCDEALEFYWNSFDGQLTAKKISNVFTMMIRDYNLELSREIKNYGRELELLVTGARYCYWVDDYGAKQCIPYTQRKIRECQQVTSQGEDVIYQTEVVFYKELENTIEFCKREHRNPLAFYENRCMHFLKGESVEAIKEGILFIKKASKTKDTELLQDAYLQQGQAYEETLEYDQAILCLTKAIDLNPNNKNAYFERAVSYFETGNIEDSFQDYLMSGIQSKPLNTTIQSNLAFSVGVTRGILQGGAEACVDYVPSLLHSLHGIGHALWAFAQDPVQVSTEFVRASRDCIDFVRNHTPQEALSQLVPELKELIEKWDELEQENKGQITGQIIGKYGVDIFIGVGLTKAMAAYRDLKRANNLLTFEAMAISKRNQEFLKAEALSRAQARKASLKSNLTIKPDDQGKHLVGHRNYELGKNRSVIEHPNLQHLVNKYAGMGIKAGNRIPGTAGYQEIVNFQEFIGYDIDPFTRRKTATTWGKIHYAKDGVHVVPTNPRS